MTNSKKFSIIITLIIFSSVLINLNAQRQIPNNVTLSDKMQDAPSAYEETYSEQVCSGGDNIVKAGCAVIAGQAVRGIPAMAFGASFDGIKRCVKNMEDRSGTSSTFNTYDPCVQFGLLNPNLDTSKFVFVNEYDPNISDNSLLGVTKKLNELNQNIVENSFDNSYYAFKAVENIPVAKSAFAQSTGELWGLGGFFQEISYNTWLTVRNVSYGLIGLLSIILGLTLMSSNSIFDNNAKWRLSLEQAIPRVIIAVILIQFSYLLGETLLFIQNNSNFEPIFRYIFNIQGGNAWSNIASGFSAAAPTTLLGAILVMTGFLPGFGQFLLIGMLVLGLWYIWRLVVLWWLNFNLVINIVLFIIGSPLIIAISLLPGEAGALQLRRYFSTLVSLLSRSFLLQLISIGPTLLVVLLIDWVWRDGVFAGILTTIISPALFLFPLIGGIIILGYADHVQNYANQFAKNVTGADPVGSQQSK